MCSSQPDAAARRLSRARLRWRRAADELLIGAIFEELRVVRRDGDGFGRSARPALMPALLPTTALNSGARQAPAPVP